MFQMFSRKSDIILKHLCSFLFEKMPASNQEPGIFLWLLLEGERGKVGVGLKPLACATGCDGGTGEGCKEPGEEFDNLFPIFQNGLHVVSTFFSGLMMVKKGERGRRRGFNSRLLDLLRRDGLLLGYSPLPVTLPLSRVAGMA